MARTMGAEIRSAAFRSCITGAVILTGACHDLTRLPGGIEADLDEWQAGFTDARGLFLDRSQAAAAAGFAGRLEARAYFGGERDPTLEAGRRESWCDLRAVCGTLPGCNARWPLADDPAAPSADLLPT